MTPAFAASAAPDSTRRFPATFWCGLGVIALCETLLFVDVTRTPRHALRSAADYANLPAARGALGLTARWVAVNMTALVWAGYVLMLEGLLHWQKESPARRRPNHFAALALASVFIWCVFDWINFYFIRAWEYFGLPPTFDQRLPGYLLAFGAVVPGMLMSGQAMLNFGWFGRRRGRRARIPQWALWASLLIGAAMFAWPFWSRNPASNYTLWCSLVLLLDPLNTLLGRPSLIRDLRNGWHGRLAALCAGGLLCGLLWEFWNFWAVAKWRYHLPFLGAAEHWRYFEMPLVGLLGFIAFGMECWVMWQTLRIPLDGLVEPLPREDCLL